ncbi:hypothetical protein [Sanguibacter sp. HDW7]|uniref:hypothetical protein n=1 Tax=Sanguibacter sp. HDW7 TaxID=2714931 RepID=UPI00140D3806|nr:hypothetical protein [Sanguibacter sp. HDW7]QIK83107.1 hypothetical protein G7063_05295 [Sanguibacter sp. HDW7]
MATTLGWPTTEADIRAATRWADTTHPDIDLPSIALAAVSMIEQRVGPWSGQVLTHTVTVRESTRAVVLPWPVASVDSVTVDGSPITVETAHDVVYLDDVRGTVVITATARDADSAPWEVKLAGRALGAFLARQEAVSPKLPGNVRITGGDNPDVDVQQGFALPRRVSEMIRPYALTGAFA